MVGLSADDEHLVANMEQRVTVGDAQLTLMNQT